MKINRRLNLAIVASLGLVTSLPLVAGSLASVDNTYGLSSSDGSIYDISSPYGGDIISRLSGRTINGLSFFATTETVTGQTGTYSPVVISGVLEVTSNVYVSDKENFARVLTYITNTGATDTTLTFATSNGVFSAARAYPLTMAVSVPMATFDATSRLRSVAVMWGSPGAAEVVDALPYNSLTLIRAEWQNVAIAAGQTIIFMEYATGTTGVGAVAGMTLGIDMLAGISTADQAKIVNWDMTDINANGQLDLMETDTDSDGMADFIETALGFTVGSDDFAGDGDADGLTDRQEFAAYTDPANADTDGDTLKDNDEITKYKTDPLLADTDGDGADDAFELANSRDPLDFRDGTSVVLSDASKDTHSPDIAIGPTGAMHITWMERNDGNYQVMYTLLDSDGSTLISPVQITASTTDNQGHPAIAIDGDDKVYISWFDSGLKDGHVIQLNPLLAARDGASTALATIQTFAPVTIATCLKTDIAVDSLSNIHFSCKSSGSIQYAVFKNDGTELVAPFIVAGSRVSGGYPWPNMVLDANNMAHMAWDSPQYAMVDGLNGATLIASTNLSGPQYHNSISLGSDGKVRIVGVSGSSSKMELTVLDPSLSPQDGSVGDTLVMNEAVTTISGANGTDTGFYSTSVMGADGEIMITYNDGGGNGIAPLYFIKVDGAGVTTVDDTAINPSTNNSYNTYMNYARMSPVDTNYVVYATGDRTALIRLARVDKTAYNTVTALSGLAAVTVTPATTPAPAASSSGSSGLFGLSPWAMLGLPALIGLLRLRRRK